MWGQASAGDGHMTAPIRSGRPRPHHAWGRSQLHQGPDLLSSVTFSKVYKRSSLFKQGS